MQKKPLISRDPQESHRVATPLELFFDLASVIAVAAAATGLHHAISENHVWEGILKYGIAFFGIWWGWVNLSWFASAFDNDDTSYRMTVLLMLAGALVMAAGVHQFFKTDQLFIPLIGYILMRIGLVYLWWRVARDDADRKTTAIRYMVGILIVQSFWAINILLFTGTVFFVLVFIAIIAELFVPWYAEQAEPTTWHPHHIAERHGLLTIIMLGELLLSVSMAIQSMMKDGKIEWQLLPIILSGFLIVFAMWWLYFSEGEFVALRSMKTTFIWAYGHVAVFASIAAVGAGLAVVLDLATDHSEISKTMAGASVAIPASIFLLSLWFLHDRYTSGVAAKVCLPVASALILGSAFTSHGLGTTAAVLVLCLVVKLQTYGRRYPSKSGDSMH